MRKRLLHHPCLPVATTIDGVLAIVSAMEKGVRTVSWVVLVAEEEEEEEEKGGGFGEVSAIAEVEAEGVVAIVAAAKPSRRSSRSSFSCRTMDVQMRSWNMADC